MRVAMAGLSLLLVLAASTVGVGDDKKGPAKKKGDADGKNDRAGVARWEWKLLDDKGKSVQTGTFTGYQDGSIKHGKMQEMVGSYKSAKNKIDATFTKGALKGEVTMTMTERKPIKYEGELVRADKSKNKIVVEIIND